MSLFSTSLKQFTTRYSKGSSYENADSEPCFSAKALFPDGVAIEGVTLEHAKRALSDILDSCDSPIYTDVHLLISHVEGVKVLKTNGQEIVKYDVPDIAFGGIDADHPSYLVLVGCHDSALKCHIFYCDDPSRAKEILVYLNNSFQNAKEIFGEEVENNNDDVFAAMSHIESVSENDSPCTKMDVQNMTKNSKKHKSRSKSESSKGIFGRLGPRSNSDAILLKSSRARLFSKDRKTSYSKLQEI